MSWLVDNARALYILFGVIGAGLVMAWWTNKRTAYLGYAAGVLALIGLVWLLTCFVVSDSKQLELNIHAMADAVVAGKVDDLFKHISADFRYKDLTRDMLYERSQQSIRAHQVSSVNITQFSVEELSREKKIAKTRFRVTARSAGEAQTFLFVTQADFVLEGNQWKLKTMRFYNPLVNQDQEMSLPGI